MKFDNYDQIGFFTVLLLFSFAFSLVTFKFLENKHINNLISVCVVETKNHLACKDLYNRK